jgi:hypothetical protein
MKKFHADMAHLDQVRLPDGELMDFVAADVPLSSATPDRPSKLWGFRVNLPNGQSCAEFRTDLTA